MCLNISCDYHNVCLSLYVIYPYTRLYTVSVTCSVQSIHYKYDFDAEDYSALI